MKKDRVCVCAVYCVFALCFVVSLSSCGMSVRRIQQEVRRQFQEKMNTHPVYSNFNITAQRVTLIKTGPHTYEGKVRILVGNSPNPHEISINVKTDGRAILWEENAMDFVSVLGLEALRLLQ